MRSLVLIPLLVLASFGSQAAPETPAANKGRTGLIRGAYDPPKDPKYQAIYDELRKERALERFAEVLGSIRLPKPLVLKFAGCDGTINAWYEPADGTVTFCYEYVADLQKSAQGAPAHGIPADQSWKGAVTFVLLHEAAHALFDILKLPILGREEDAADQVAAFTLLRAGEGIARRTLAGAAYMYLHDSKGRMPDDSDFADVHGLDSQRFYNVLCMAYGSNPESFKGMIDKGYLPKARAEGCGDEYKQVAYAVKVLIDPSVDVQMAASIRKAKKSEWESPAKPAQAADSQPK